MNKNKISSYFIFIAFFTFISILLTIAQNSYSNLMNPTKEVEENKFLEPLNPILDSAIIQEIEKRQALNEKDELSINNSSTSDQVQVDLITSSEASSSVTPQNNTNPVSKQAENN